MRARKFGWALVFSMLPLSLAQALEPVSLYGQVKFSLAQQTENLTQVDDKSCAGSRKSLGFDDGLDCKVSGVVLTSELSYIGARGGVELGGDLEAFYAAEAQFSFANQAYYGLRNKAYSGQSLVARNVYIGLRDLWGALTFGRNDSVLKTSQGQVDLFNLQPGGIDDVFAGELRRDQMVNYFSPKWAMFQFGVSLVGGQDPLQEKATKYATVDQPESPKMGYAAMLGFGDPVLKDQSYHVALAFSKDLAEIEPRTTLNATSSQGLSGALDRDVVRFSAQAKFGGLRLGLMYQYQTYAEKHLQNRTVTLKGHEIKESAFVLDNDQHNWLLSTGYQIADTELKLQWVHSDLQSDIYSVGADYFLDSKFKVYFYYSARNDELTFHDAGKVKSFYVAEYSYIALGFEFKF